MRQRCALPTTVVSLLLSRRVPDRRRGSFPLAEAGPLGRAPREGTLRHSLDVHDRGARGDPALGPLGSEGTWLTAVPRDASPGG